MQPTGRIRIALAALGAAGGCALALGAVSAWPTRSAPRPWAGPEAVARAWLDAVRAGNGSAACGLMDATLLERMGGTIGGCAARFQDPRPMQFRILSVAESGGVFHVRVATTREVGTIDVHQEGIVYRVRSATFTSGSAEA